MKAARASPLLVAALCILLLALSPIPGDHHRSYRADHGAAEEDAMGDGGSRTDGWNVTKVDETGIVGCYTSIAVDDVGNIHISYHDASTAFFGGMMYAHGAIPEPATLLLLGLGGLGVIIRRKR